MTPPCNIEPKLVSTQDGPFFRLDYFASPEACVFYEAESSWNSDSIAELRITNTSPRPITIYTSSNGSLRPVSTHELALPDRVATWRSGPSRGKPPEQIEAVVPPGGVWTSNPTRIFNPVAAIAVKNRRALGRGFAHVELDRPRPFAVTTRFLAKVAQSGTEHAVDVLLNSVLNVTYIPEETEAQD